MEHILQYLSQQDVECLTVSLFPPSCLMFGRPYHFIYVCICTILNEHNCPSGFFRRRSTVPWFFRSPKPRGVLVLGVIPAFPLSGLLQSSLSSGSLTLHGEGPPECPLSVLELSTSWAPLNWTLVALKPAFFFLLAIYVTISSIFGLPLDQMTNLLHSSYI